MSNQEGTAVPQKIELTVSGILADLDNGLNRQAIRAKYRLTVKDTAELFQHPKLKGKKPRTGPTFILIDDTVEMTVADVAEPLSEEPAITQPTVTIDDNF